MRSVTTEWNDRPERLMDLNLDDSGPLYRQITARIGYCIATGRLPAGAALPSLRRAGAAWGVHLHTVRRAYRELQDAGLVQIHERGDTVVLGHPTPSPRSLRELVADFLSAAGRTFGATPETVQKEIRQITEEPVAVSVVECSRTLAASISAQLAAAWQVTPIPRLLTEEWPCAEIVVATYFHLQQLRKRLDGAAMPVAYVRIRLSPRMPQAIVTEMRRTQAHRIALCETDLTFAAQITAELRAALGYGVAISVHTPVDIGDFLDVAERSALKLVSPRNWDRLSRERTATPGVLPLEYQVHPADVEDLGRRFGWRQAAGIPRA